MPEKMASRALSAAPAKVAPRQKPIWGCHGDSNQQWAWR